MRIRRFQDSDHDEVWALHNLALEAVGSHPGSGPWDDNLHQIKELYLDNRGEFLVGVLRGSIVAMGALKRSSKERAEIKRMRVHPDCQRRGFGRAILQALEARAAELGYTALHLDTTFQQVAAQRLYSNSGYVETGRTSLGQFEVILYEKRLTGA